MISEDYEMFDRTPKTRQVIEPTLEHKITYIRNGARMYPNAVNVKHFAEKCFSTIGPVDPKVFYSTFFNELFKHYDMMHIALWIVKIVGLKIPREEYLLMMSQTANYDYIIHGENHNLLVQFLLNFKYSQTGRIFAVTGEKFEEFGMADLVKVISVSGESDKMIQSMVIRICSEMPSSHTHKRTTFGVGDIEAVKELIAIFIDNPKVLEYVHERCQCDALNYETNLKPYFL